MNLKGYRTIIANIVAVIASVGLFFGVVIPEDERAAVIAGLVAIVNIALRFATSTRVGQSGPPD
ncbi:MAG TPA: hypothetical protein PKD75_13700 [Tepidiformaceae bacterium]|nr:hypothetical protein [Tepidiformaceae bacterium]